MFVPADAPLTAIVPSVELPPTIPPTLHVTLVEAVPAPATVAVKTCAPPAGTLPVAGEIFTAMLAGETGTVAEVDAAAEGADVVPQDSDNNTIAASSNTTNRSVIGAFRFSE